MEHVSAHRSLCTPAAPLAALPPSPHPMPSRGFEAAGGLSHCAARGQKSRIASSQAGCQRPSPMGLLANRSCVHAVFTGAQADAPRTRASPAQPTPYTRCARARCRAPERTPIYTFPSTHARARLDDIQSALFTRRVDHARMAAVRVETKHLRDARGVFRGPRVSLPLGSRQLDLC